MSSIVIGIDPDLDKSGVAVVIDRRLVTLDAMGLFPLTVFILEHWHKAHFVVEAVEWDRAVYQRPKISRKGMLKIGQDVGKVKATGKFIGEFLAGCYAQFSLVKQLKGEIMWAKDDRAFFNRLTGWSKAINEDKRDAVLLALYWISDR